MDSPQQTPTPENTSAETDVLSTDVWASVGSAITGRALCARAPS
jgi:ornithine carbamoyltransferase